MYQFKSGTLIRVLRRLSLITFKMSLARARTFRVLKAAMKSAKRCPSRDKQLEILYTIRHTFDNNMRNLGSLDDKKALLLIEDSEREVDMMVS